MVKIQINGEKKEIGSTMTLMELLDDLQIKYPAIAVAVNSEIIPRSEYPRIKIHDGDSVEVIQPVGGG